MKTILANITVALLALALLAGCKSDTTEPAKVTTPSTTVQITKRGVDYNGGEVIISVHSNTYWVINYDTESVDWFTLSPRAAFGDADVVLNVKPNEGDQRRATLHFDTQEGNKLEIDVFQSGVNEPLSIFCEDFGTADSDTAVRYRDYSQRGIGSAFVEYAGDALIATDGTPSTGYEGASGGNCAIFGAEHTTLSLGAISTADDNAFRLSFGICNTNGTPTVDDMAVEASLDGEAWYKVRYDIATPAESGKWYIASALFHTVDVKAMHLRFTCSKNYMVDDIMLVENLGEDKGYELEFGIDGDDNHEIGYNYFSDYFDWVTADFGGTDYIVAPNLNTQETRFDNVYLLRQSLIDEFETAGWSQPDKATPAYLRLGYIKLGKSKTAGCVESPALTAIREGRTIHVKLSFKATILASADGATKDLDNIKIEVLNGGTINSADKTEIELPVGVFNSWEDSEQSVIIYNATHETKIRFKTAYSTDALVALGKSNRFFIDEVDVAKISKATPIEENWAETLSAPTIGNDGITCTKNSISIRFAAIPHAFRYEYRITRKSDGTDVATGIVNTPSISVGDLQTDTDYAVTVRALGHEESLRYQPSEWSAEVIATPVDLDKHPAGYVFFEDDLAWLAGDTFRAGWYTAGGGDGETGFRIDNLESTLSADAKTIWSEHGYTRLTDKAYNYLYIHGDSYFRFGRAYNKGNCMAGIDLPKSAVSAITDGAAINVLFSINAKYNNAGDYGVVIIKAKTGDSEQIKRIALDTSDNLFKPYSAVFENVNNTTVFTICNTNEGGKADRFWINSFKITKQ